MTTTEAKKIKVPMSERRPLSIVVDEWPIIACADWYSGQHECQANYTRMLIVREHADGRRVVYGDYERGPGGAPIGFRGSEGGFLVPGKVGYPVPTPDDDETVRAIRRVAGIIGDEQLGDECIRDLPSEDIDAHPARPASRGPSDAEPLGDFWGAVSRMNGVAVSKEKLATLLALLVQARPHCPADLQQEIVEALAAGANEG
jgi:hypothetical protein